MLKIFSDTLLPLKLLKDELILNGPKKFIHLDLINLISVKFSSFAYSSSFNPFVFKNFKRKRGMKKRV